MRRTTKIQAFTLGEMLVVLLLTTLVVGACFTVLQLVRQHMFAITDNYEVRTECNLLRRSLWIDFNQSDLVRYDAKTGILHFEGGKDPHAYRFENALIIKDTDTFDLQIEETTYFFNGNKVGSGEIDAFEFKTAKAFGSQRVFVYKRNAATSFMND
ncbi:hypothetical protein ABV409_15010 [Flagellimonas sp. DF-77]|uniref:hypothetical protein n=1 Tax=Flagellimonas algarum TaxID=3230298 RepID=UPI00339974F3